MSSTALRVAVCALLLAALLPAILSACPLCKEDVSGNDPNAGSQMWRGMFWSILLMVTMPFAAAGTIVVLVLRARRRAMAGART